MQIVEHFSTEDVPPPERLPYWSGMLRRAFGDDTMSIVPQRGLPYEGTFSGWQMGTSGFMRVASTPVTVGSERRSERACRTPERAIFVMQESGMTLVHQANKVVQLNRRDFTLHLAPQPWSLTCLSSVRLVSLALPYDRLASRIGDLQRLVGVHVNAKRGAFIGSFLAALTDQVDIDEDEAWGEAVIEVMLDIITLTYRPASQKGRGRGDTKVQWQRAVRDFVDRHLTDPELGAGLIARRLGVTPRYVQMVFAGMATTASKFICGRRLDLAAGLLADPSRTVLDIATEVGFSDVSYFYRCFHRRFGISPRAYRTR